MLNQLVTIPKPMREENTQKLNENHIVKLNGLTDFPQIIGIQQLPLNQNAAKPSKTTATQSI